MNDRLARAAARLAGLFGTTCLAGCASFSGVYDLPLPGGADVGADPYRVTAVFRDVLDLVPQSAVKVRDVAVGRVERIELADDGRSARVTVVVDKSVRLPANAVAWLRQSSVLGEKFVELDGPPDVPPEGTLVDGDVIRLDRTNRNPEIEEVLGALSMLLNGGGIGQLRHITTELNAALGGNENEIRSFLSNLDTFVTGLDARRADIGRALDGLGKLSANLGDHRKEITNLIDNLHGGIEVLAAQRSQLVALLASLDRLSGVAVDTIRRSQANLIADLRALEPTLRRLTEAGQNLPDALALLLTFPFPDSVLDAIKGDYLNTYIQLDAKTGGR